MRNKVINTEIESITHKLVVGMGEKGSGIIAQEATGQRQLLQATQMPVKINSPHSWTGRGIELLTKLGFIFEDNGNGVMMDSTIGDALFVDCLLPEGWEKRGSDHNLWSYVDDEQGRERMSIFYKAAFYDRDAFINLSCRFSSGTETLLPEGERREDWYYKPSHHLPQYGYIKDAGKLIWKTEILTPVPGTTYPDPTCYLTQYKILEAEAKSKILEMFPEYQDPFAYWDQKVIN